MVIPAATLCRPETVGRPADRHTRRITRRPACRTCSGSQPRQPQLVARKAAARIVDAKACAASSFEFCPSLRSCQSRASCSSAAESGTVSSAAFVQSRWALLIAHVAANPPIAPARIPFTMRIALARRRPASRTAPSGRSGGSFLVARSRKDPVKRRTEKTLSGGWRRSSSVRQPPTRFAGSPRLGHAAQLGGSRGIHVEESVTINPSDLPRSTVSGATSRTCRSS